MSRQLISADEASTVTAQRRKPCSDCPFSRASLPGWLGDLSARDWLRVAHGESKADCHTEVYCDGGAPECAGLAIYRANVVKRVRDPHMLVLPKDTRLVFATSLEFLAHHGGDA